MVATQGDRPMNESRDTNARGMNSRDTIDAASTDKLSALVRLLEDAAGITVDGAAHDASFFELGLDSLFLTQFSVSVGRRFGVELSFRRLSGEFDTLNKLAAFLDSAASSSGPGTSPLDPCTPPPNRWVPGAGRVPSRTSRSIRAAASADPLIALFRSQIDIMQQQIDALDRTVSPDSASLIEAGPETGTAGTASLLDASRPPVPDARLGRDPAGKAAWFVPRADQPGKYVKLQ